MGLTGYGGMAVIQQIKREYVSNHKIVDDRKFLQSLGLAQILPGSTIISLIAYFSYLKAGLVGAFVSTALYILPAFIMTSILSATYFKYGNLPAISQIVGNLNILLISLLISAFIGIGRSVYFKDEKIDYRGILITLVSGGLYFFTHLSIVFIIIASGSMGIVIYFFTGYLKDSLSLSEIKTGKLFLRKKAWALLLMSIGFFGVTVFYISEPLWKLFSSFLKIGSLAFGGGVAAIPLMENNLVIVNGWFTRTEFWDGMAISQITPGPILNSAAFFGYRIAGIAGAFVSTVAIIIPSFLLVIIFGKFYERIKHLGIIRSVFRGFLAGFMGILAVLIIRRFPDIMTSWEALLLFGVLMLVIFRTQKGLVPALLTTLIYTLIAWYF
jgi:chromate transporter